MYFFMFIQYVLRVPEVVYYRDFQTGKRKKKIDEHLDAIQEVPEKPANPTACFIGVLLQPLNNPTQALEGISIEVSSEHDVLATIRRDCLTSHTT
jgi:hypothetical protein